ncbi:ankyrin repeat-containing domain protein [Tricladium varicosporioides]|nr:ankyrin repeat-containing domain protein [Hymenoscyphus varicosporioides]
MENIKKRSFYEYRPIDLDKPAIRLIRLFQGKFTDNIYCELFEGYLDQEIGVPYHALSYSWGSNEKKSMVIIDNKIMDITLNLFQALQHLRYENEDRIMWVDAICIDQNNELEKGHQVNQMGRIYKEAEYIVIWLGLATPESDLLIDFSNQTQDTHLLHGDWRNLARIALQHKTKKAQALLDRGMTSVLKRPWFRRIWILQEVANARVAIVQCGNKFVSSRIFAQLPSLIGLKVHPHSQAVLDIMPGFSRKESWWAETRTLQTLLMKFRESEATDKRDIIYALLNISSDAYNSDILVPDYTKSMSQVLKTTSLFLLSEPYRDYPTYKAYSTFQAETLSEFFENLNCIDDQVLRNACQVGNKEDVKLLLTKTKFKLNSRVNSKTPIHQASEGGRQALAELLLRHGVDDKTVDLYRSTPPQFTVEGRYEDAIEFVLEHRTSIKTTKGYPPQKQLEAAMGNVDAIRCLLTWRAGIQTEHNYASTPLELAAEGGHRGIVEVLLEHGATIETTNGRSPTLLQLAAEGGHEGVVKVLLKHGATIETTDEWLPTLLQLAVAGGHEGVADILLKHGASINITNYYPTLLQLAVAGRHKGVVEVLLKHGASIEATDQYLPTPLQLAAKGGYERIITVLLKHGASIETTNYYPTPVQLAAKGGHRRVVMVLLKHGATIETTDGRPPTLLQLAAEGGHEGVVEVLLEHGATIETTDGRPPTPLQLAVEGGHKDVVKFLLTHDASIKTIDERLPTPLQLAAEGRQKGVVEVLLKHSASIETTNNYGSTLSRLVLRRRRKDLFEGSP